MQTKLYERIKKKFKRKIDSWMNLGSTSIHDDVVMLLTSKTLLSKPRRLYIFIYIIPELLYIVMTRHQYTLLFYFYQLFNSAYAEKHSAMYLVAAGSFLRNGGAVTSNSLELTTSWSFIGMALYT